MLGPPKEEVATSTWDWWPHDTSPGNGSILLPSSEVWQLGSLWGPHGTDTSLWGPCCSGTACAVVPRTGHIPTGMVALCGGAALLGWLQEESPALTDPHISCACPLLPTASANPALSPHHALGCRVLSPGSQLRPPLSFGTCSLPSGEETFPLTSAPAAAAACKYYKLIKRKIKTRHISN